MNGSERRLGRAVVNAAVERFKVSEARERSRLYRLHLQATIHSVSPLAIDLAAHGRVRLDDVAAVLPIPPRWPGGGKGFGTLGWSAWSARGSSAPPNLGMPKVSAASARRLRTGGIAVRGRSDPDGDLGFLPQGGVLEAVAAIGVAHLHTLSGDAFLHLPQTLPDTTLAALVGRPVDALASHPVLDGRCYLVTAAFADDFQGGTVVVFRTGLLPHELPWRQELACEVRNHIMLRAAAALGTEATPLSRYFATAPRSGSRSVTRSD